jgi:hypothetical protein
VGEVVPAQVGSAGDVAGAVEGLVEAGGGQVPGGVSGGGEQQRFRVGWSVLVEVVLQGGDQV